MALLAAYKLNRYDGESLEEYLENKVFSSAESVTLMAEQDDIDGFNVFLERYVKGLECEKAAVASIE